jgi:hypothetical protein
MRASLCRQWYAKKSPDKHGPSAKPTTSLTYRITSPPPALRQVDGYRPLSFAQGKGIVSFWTIGAGNRWNREEGDAR